MNRSESKYFATAARMDEAFLELLEKKDFTYITVKEICEKAGVNRSTFYLHYETVSDLLAESARYIIDQFVEAMPHEYLTPYLNYLKKHRRILRTTLEQASVLGMNDAYLSLNRHVFIPILNRYHVPLPNQKYMMPFYINGIMGIVNEWLKENCEDSIEHMISVIQVCIPGHQFEESQR